MGRKTKICKTCLFCGKHYIAAVEKRMFCSNSCATRYRFQKVKASREKECLDCISKCKSKRELKRRFRRAYKFGSYHHLKEFEELPLGESLQKVYSYNEVLEAARKYKTKAEFHKNDLILYFCALRRGWMKDFKWLRSEQHLFHEINFVYRYYFQEQNAVYVGRTIDIEQRDMDHKRDRGKESSTVFKFAQENGVEIPKIEILERNLSGEESQIVEDRYVRQYRNEGKVVLNKGATGLGTGSLGIKKYYTEKKFFEEAIKYEWISDFKRECPRVYAAGCKNGWIQKCDFLKRRLRRSSLFTKVYCLERSKLYKSRKELLDNDSAVYTRMIKN